MSPSTDVYNSRLVVAANFKSISFRFRSEWSRRIKWLGFSRMMASASAEPMKLPAPVSNIALPKIVFSSGFSCLNRSLHAAAHSVSYAHDLVSIHRRTEGSTVARREVRLFTQGERRKVAGGNATSRRQVIVEQARVALGGMRYG